MSSAGSAFNCSLPAGREGGERAAAAASEAGRGGRRAPCTKAGAPGVPGEGDERPAAPAQAPAPAAAACAPGAGGEAGRGPCALSSGLATALGRVVRGAPRGLGAESRPPPSGPTSGRPPCAPERQLPQERSNSGPPTPAWPKRRCFGHPPRGRALVQGCELASARQLGRPGAGCGRRRGLSFPPGSQDLSKLAVLALPSRRSSLVYGESLRALGEGRAPGLADLVRAGAHDAPRSCVGSRGSLCGSWLAHSSRVG